MKRLHRPDLYAWSTFDESRDIDFNSVAWVRRPAGNVLIDPLPLTEHDREHLDRLGGVVLIVVTNSDHVRGARQLADHFRATVAGPRAERAGFPLGCERWLGDGDEPVPGLRVIEMHGSKTPGELALVLEQTTLITGDLVRGQVGGTLNLLPDSKLADRNRATASIERIVAEYPKIDAVLVGDGWPLFHGGANALAALAHSAAAQR
jgi:glyoxylase-like metal-dependent hydrolase (beta-lactamase superfamily II)